MDYKNSKQIQAEIDIKNSQIDDCFKKIRTHKTEIASIKIELTSPLLQILKAPSFVIDLSGVTSSGNTWIIYRPIKRAWASQIVSFQSVVGGMYSAISATVTVVTF